MMYCINCGKKIDGNNFCTYCGTKAEGIEEMNNNYCTTVKEEKSGLKTASIVLGILGIVGAILCIFAPVSLILSIIGLVLGIVSSKKVRNVSGIVLNSIGLFLSIIMLVVMIFIIRLAVNYVGNIDLNFNDTDGSSLHDFFDGFIDEFDDYFDDGYEKEENDRYYERF